jgi:hypothetical protein
MRHFTDGLNDQTTHKKKKKLSSMFSLYPSCSTISPPTKQFSFQFAKKQSKRSKAKHNCFSSLFVLHQSAFLFVFGLPIYSQKRCTQE